MIRRKRCLLRFNTGKCDDNCLATDIITTPIASDVERDILNDGNDAQKGAFHKKIA